MLITAQLKLMKRRQRRPKTKKRRLKLMESIENVDGLTARLYVEDICVLRMQQVSFVPNTSISKPCRRTNKLQLNIGITAIR